MKNTCPNDNFTCLKKKVFFALKDECPQHTFSFPDLGNCYFLVFQNDCPNLLLLAPGNWASAYVHVAPCR